MANISYYKDSTDTTGVKVNYKSILREIKKGKWKGDIEYLACYVNEGRVADYQEKKKLLPSVTFSGYFPKRLDTAIESYTNIMCLDLDHLSPEQIILYKETLKDDKFIHAFFLSPSQKGLKILVKVSSDEEYHIQAYLTLEKYFKESYAVVIDPKCKNLSRLCYVSYDPDLYLNDDSEVYPIDCKFKTTNSGTNNFDKRPEKYKGWVLAKNAKQSMEICIKWTERHHQYEQGNRNNYLHILACNMNRAGVDMTDATLLAYNDYSDMDFKELEQCFKSAYKRTHEHNSIDIYADTENLPKHTEEEAAMSICESEVYNTTVELLEKGVKRNTVFKLAKALALTKEFTEEEANVIVDKGVAKYDKIASESLIIHKSAEDYLLEAVADYKDNGGVPTTIPEFDEMIGGGLMPGYFYGLIGKGGTFKSILAQWIGSENSRIGGLTLYINSEMSLLLLLDRVVEKELGIHLMRGLKEKTITVENVAQITADLKEVVGGNFEIINGSGYNRESIISTVKGIEEQTGKKVKMIICDGLSQLEDTKKNEIHSAIFNSGELKEVAKITNTVVLALVHVSGGIQQHVRDTSKFTRAGDKVLNNMDGYFCTSLLIDEHSSNMETGDIMYLPGKFYLRFIDKRGSGAVLNKIISVHRPLKLEPLSVDPQMMEVSLKV